MEQWTEMVFGKIKKVRNMLGSGKTVKLTDKAFIPLKTAITRVNHSSFRFI